MCDWRWPPKSCFWELPWGCDETSEKSVMDNTSQFTTDVDVKSRKAMSWVDVVTKKKKDVKKMPFGACKLVGTESASMLTLFTKRK